MWTQSEVERVVTLLRDQLGKKYAIGGKDEKTGKWVVRGKPLLDDKDPSEFECSGLSRWIIAQGLDQAGKRIVLPHGTFNQIKVCRALGAEKWRELDLGFSDRTTDEDSRVDHVIIRINETSVIEARGKPFGKVVQRPVAAWELYDGFFGWWRVPGIWDNNVLVK